MDDSIGFSFIVAVKSGGMLGFREAMESLRAMEYEHMTIHILDSADEHEIEEFVRVVAASDPRIVYHRMQQSMSMPALWNQGIRYAKEDYLVFVGPMVRLNEIMPSVLAARIRQNLESHIIYSDYDELSEDVRVNPQFLPDFNLELLRHTNYIGDTFCVRKHVFREIGLFSEQLIFSFSYDFFLRAYEAGLRIEHIPALLWHRRVVPAAIPHRQLKAELRRTMAEHRTVLLTHFARLGIKADAEPDSSFAYFDIEYEGGDAGSHHREYLLVHEEGIKVRGRNAYEILYGHVRQPDVAIAGVRFVSTGRTLDNCGYIYDTNGMLYPACYGQKSTDQGLYGRIAIAQDVSMVDPGYCMIDARFFRKVGGFDRKLSGREMMLDLCLKARRAGMRVVYEPLVTARCGKREHTSSEYVHGLLMERWGSVIARGDPCYNINLPTGLSSNYSL